MTDQQVPLHVLPGGGERLLEVERVPRKRTNDRARLGRAIVRTAVRVQYAADVYGISDQRTRRLLDEHHDAVTDYFAAGCVTAKDLRDV
jgi:hypothetical protein